MADAIVHISITDLEPFKRFIGKITEAHGHFYAPPPKRSRHSLTVQYAAPALLGEPPVET